MRRIGRSRRILLHLQLLVRLIVRRRCRLRRRRMWVCRIRRACLLQQISLVSFDLHIIEERTCAIPFGSIGKPCPEGCWYLFICWGGVGVSRHGVVAGRPGLIIFCWFRACSCCRCRSDVLHLIKSFSIGLVTSAGNTGLVSIEPGTDSFHVLSISSSFLRT